MSYRYRCAQCRTTSPAAATRREMEDERDRHRQLAHGGHIPDGEQVIVGAGRARRRPSVAVLVLVALLVIGAVTSAERWLHHL